MILSRDLPAVILAMGLVLTGCQGDKPGVQPNNGPGYAATADVVAPKPCHARHINENDPEAWLPDLSCTPGKANPTVTIGMLCPVAHTGQWRVNIATQKKKSLAQYNYVDSGGDHPQTLSSTEGDHVVALVLGGDPTAPENIWAEPQLKTPNEKDHVELAAHAALCAGKLSLPQVQAAIATDWYGFGKRLGVIS